MKSDKYTSALTPEIIEKFKTAVEIGKWQDGKKLTPEQVETCMQAIITYEHAHVDETERTAYVPPKATPCAPKDDEDVIKWEK